MQIDITAIAKTLLDEMDKATTDLEQQKRGVIMLHEAIHEVLQSMKKNEETTSAGQDSESTGAAAPEAAAPSSDTQA